MKNYTILLFLLLFVFLSGCTLLGQQQGPTDGGKKQAIGVIIKSFKSDVSEIFSGDSVTFSLTVENVGEEDATEVRAKLIGLGTDWSGEVNEIKDISDLQKRLQNSPGGISDVQWDVTSPENLKVDTSYTAGVIVHYKYASTAHGKIKVISNDYIKTHPQEADKILKTNGIESFTATKAPIEISIAGAPMPFVYRESGQTASVSVQLKNVGQGYPYVDQQTDRKVTIDKITVNGEECLDQHFPKDVTIPTDSYKTITCKFNLPEVSEYTTIPLDVEINYYYYVESTASIKVLKAI
ncbi:MAG: hypothetical protein QW412_03730 [Candidatus Aenigmatarchaeota archaeon]